MLIDFHKNPINRLYRNDLRRVVWITPVLATGSCKLRPFSVVREKLLGHMLAHEITHILQGSALHSDSGLMKEHWDQAELAQINDHYLSFTDLDVKLIYAGLPMRRGGGLYRGCQSVE